MIIKKLVSVKREDGSLAGTYQVQLASEFKDHVFEKFAIDMAIVEGDADEHDCLSAHVLFVTGTADDADGRSVKARKAPFLRDPTTATEVGRKGGKSVSAAKRTFNSQPGLAARAGKQGGLAKARNRLDRKDNNDH